MNTSSRFALFAIVAALLFAAIPGGVSADCTYIDRIDQDPILVCTYASYYATLIAEPDWCDYAYGDGIFVRDQVVSGVLTRTGWYIVRADDHTTTPPSDFGQYQYGAVGSGCAVVVFPFLKTQPRAVIGHPRANRTTDCEVFHIDDPSCIPCPFVFVGYWFGVGTYEDGSEVEKAGERYQNCDGVNRDDVFYQNVWCPNGPDALCQARDLNP